jgi:hypothetical protein
MGRRLVRAVALVVVAGLGAGCDSLCENAAERAREVNDKLRPCLEGGGDYLPYDQATCEARVDGCNEHELELIETNLDCLEDVSECSESNRSVALGQLFGCTPAERVSDACHQSGLPLVAFQ